MRRIPEEKAAQKTTWSIELQKNPKMENNAKSNLFAVSLKYIYLQ